MVSQDVVNKMYKNIFVKKDMNDAYRAMIISLFTGYHTQSFNS